MTLSAREILAGVLAVQQQLIRPEELAETLASGRSPGARLASSWATLTADAQTQLDASRADSLAPQTVAPTDDDGAFATVAPGDEGGAPRSPHRPHAVRFSRLALHAKGGLGAVYLAKDEELGRTVALKEIQEQHADHGGSRSRFTFEAEITGQLEHPGIVPVYGLGSYADGRPYYAMRFIKGEPMDDAIRRFHKADVPGRDPAERALALRDLLRRFIDTRNALAFAHARGIIHRDVKPANVMLGEFGETLVVDWGLAKYVGRPDGPAAPTATGSATGTLQGLVVGTPAYMPPEQARGEQDKVGPCSDVYALGATLYHLLTGKLPVEAEGAFATLEKTKRGERTPARVANASVPKALEAVCDRAMAFEPGARYHGAKELAAEVERWLADEPVRAYAEPLSLRLRRWAKRHRTLVTAAAVLLLAGVVGLGVGLWAVNRERARTAKQRDEANENLERALKAEDEAKANLKLAREAVDETFGLARNHPILKRDNALPVRKLLLEKVLPYYASFRDRRPDDPELATQQGKYLSKAAYITGQIGRQEDAIRDAEQARDVFLALHQARPDVVEHRMDLAECWNNLGIFHSNLGRQNVAIDCYAKSRELFAGLAADHPELTKPRRYLGNTLNNLALLHAETGKSAEALKLYGQAREAIAKLVADHPTAEHRADLANAYNNLGTLQQDLNQLDDARASFVSGRDVLETLSKETGESARRADLARTVHNLGRLDQTMGRFDEAKKNYERARDLQTALARDYPDVKLHRTELARTFINLGTLLGQTNKLKEAAAVFGQARDVLSALLEAEPAVTINRYYLAMTLQFLGRLRRMTGENAEALAAQERSVTLFVELLKKEPDHPDYQARLQNVRTLRAKTLADLARPEDAAAAWDEVIRLAPPAGRNQLRVERATDAVSRGEYRRAVEDATALMREGKGDGLFWYDLACLFSLASAAADRDAARPLPQRRKDAESWAKQAVELLGRSGRAGYFANPGRVAHAKQDSDLDPLRGRDDYMAWLADVEARANKK